MPFARAKSSSVPYMPVSSIFRHRNARASALTMALSTRGRGAHSAPSGVTTSFRPPRFRNVIGMCTVIVSLSAETVARVTPLPLAARVTPLPLAARVTPLPLAARHFPHQLGEAVRPQADVHALHPHVDPLDQQLHDPRLLGWEEFVPTLSAPPTRS